MFIGIELARYVIVEATDCSSLDDISMARNSFTRKRRTNGSDCFISGFCFDIERNRNFAFDFEHFSHGCSFLVNKKAGSSNDESALLTNKTVNCTAEIGIECYLSYNTYSTRFAQLGNCSFCVVQYFFAAAHNCLMSAAEYPKSKYAIGSFLSSCCHSLRRAILSSSA